MKRSDPPSSSADGKPSCGPPPSQFRRLQTWSSGDEPRLQDVAKLEDDVGDGLVGVVGDKDGLQWQGPQTIEDTFNWPSDFLGKMARSPFLRVVECFRQGIGLATHYSGIDMPASAIAFLQLAIQKHLRVDSLETWQGLHAFHAAEIDPSVRGILLAHKGLSKSCHVFGDLLLRYDDAVVERANAFLKEKMDEAAALIQSGEPKASVIDKMSDLIAEGLEKQFKNCRIASKKKCWCYVHNDWCRVWDPRSSGLASDAVIGMVAGSCCYAFSAMGGTDELPGPQCLFCCQLLFTLSSFVQSRCVHTGCQWHVEASKVPIYLPMFWFGCNVNSCLCS